jgi:hypothetical protein
MTPADLFHRCPACELMLPAVENQRDDRCPSCLMSEGRGVAMDLITLTATAEPQHAAPKIPR